MSSEKRIAVALTLTSHSSSLAPLLLRVLCAALLFAVAPARAAEPYGIGLEGFPYPQPVSMFATPGEGDSCLIYRHTPDATDLYYYAWCHGPAGTSRLFYRLYQITGDRSWMGSFASKTWVQALAWFVIGNLLIVDAVFNIGLAFVAHKFKSRVAAIFLLLLTVLSVMVGILLFALGGLAFNPFIPLVLIGRLFASGRMVFSTFMLKKYAVETFIPPPPPPMFQPEGAPQWAAPAASTQ